MRGRSRSLVVVLAARGLAPVIQLFALYVVFHGHYSPGGGFQGGVLLAASFVLVRLAEGYRVGQRQVPRRAGPLLGAAGVLVFVGVGGAAFLTGGNFLDHGRVPVPGPDPAGLRSLMILVIEVGVAIAVAAVLTALYDELLGDEDDG